jgi:hypothetical protein
MSMIFESGELYPTAKMNANSFDIVSTITITEELQFNPVKVCWQAFGTYEHGDLLWLVNHVRNPFKELTVGKIIKVPYLPGVSKAVATTKQNAPVKTSNVKISGDKIIY